MHVGVRRSNPDPAVAPSPSPNKLAAEPVRSEGKSSTAICHGWGFKISVSTDYLTADLIPVRSDQILMIR
jgi:hypothetical protein